MIVSPETIASQLLAADRPSPDWEEVRAQVLARVDSEINYAGCRECGERTLRAYRAVRAQLAAVTDPEFWLFNEHTSAFWLLNEWQPEGSVAA